MSPPTPRWRLFFFVKYDLVGVDEYNQPGEAMDTEHRIIRRQKFGRFGTIFEVRICTIYLDPVNSELLCILWDAVCEEKISPLQIVKIEDENAPKILPELSGDYTNHVAGWVLDGVNIREDGDILTLNILEEFPNLWQNHPGTSVEWHKRIKSFKHQNLVEAA
jgi:hypothetical protein